MRSVCGHGLWVAAPRLALATTKHRQMRARTTQRARAAASAPREHRRPEGRVTTRQQAATWNWAGAPSAVNLQGETEPRSGEVRQLVAVVLRPAVQAAPAAGKREQAAARSRAWVPWPTFRNSIVRAAPLPTAASWPTRRVVAGRGWRWPSRRRRPLLSIAQRRFVMPSIQLAAAPPRGSRSKMEHKWVGLGKLKSKLRAMAEAARHTTRAQPSRAARRSALTSNIAACRRVGRLAPRLRPIVCKPPARTARA